MAILAQPRTQGIVARAQPAQARAHAPSSRMRLLLRWKVLADLAECVVCICLELAELVVLGPPPGAKAGRLLVRFLASAVVASSHVAGHAASSLTINMSDVLRIGGTRKGG